MAFIFGGNTPWTYEQLQSKRRIAEELMAANMGTPRNVGEGLTAIGRALAIRGINKKADKRDAELKGEYDTARGAVLSALMGGAPGAAPSMAAPGVTAPVDPNSPQGVANDTMKALGKAPDFSALEAQYGLPAGYLERTAMIESGGNPNAQNPNSSAGGMFQFIDSTAKQYGLTDKTDPLASADAAARLAADNRAYLAKALGREPTAGELYLAHQQGAGGAARLLAAGNAPAASVVGGDAVGLNGGNAGMTAADFAGKWTGKFGETVQPANADIGTIADLLANPYATPGDKAILGALLQQRMDAADPMKRIEMERAQLELEALRNPQANVPDAVRSRVMLAEQAGLTPDMPEYQTYILTGELPKPADPMKRIEMERAQLELEALRNPQAKDTRTDDIREYEFARSQGYDGTFQQFMTDMKKAGAATQTVNVGGETSVPADEAELRKKLGGKEGELWASYLESGGVASGTAQDMEMLDALIEMAPAGPVQGRLVEMFPGISDAGAAFQSVVLRVAPTLRAPGSGSTSDIEYEGMLKSLPMLRNRPNANRAIATAMKTKAQINMDRAAVVSAYQSEQITASEARARLQEINSRSIMTPELKSAITTLTPETGEAPDGISKEEWDAMTPEDRALWAN